MVLEYSFGLDIFFTDDFTPDAQSASLHMVRLFHTKKYKKVTIMSTRLNQLATLILLCFSVATEAGVQISSRLYRMLELNNER